MEIYPWNLPDSEATISSFIVIFILLISESDSWAAAELRDEGRCALSHPTVSLCVHCANGER